MREQLSELPRLLTAHLQLSLLALLVGVALSVPLGVFASRSPRVERAVLGVASALQTIPSLALLALMVPALAAIGLRSIGFLPAFLALVLYSTFPILRNTVVALQGVEPALVEAARAVGMTPRQQLLRVELPLALPVIVAGVRTATVWTVGTATLATPVGADSLGNYIFAGLQTRNLTAVSVGCVAAAVLALALDALGRALFMAVRRRDRRLLLGAVAPWAALYLYAGAAFAWQSGPARQASITLGAKTFTEQYILSEALALHVQRATGVRATVQQSLGSSVVFDALTSGAIDAYVDYTGTIWTTVMKQRDTTLPRAAMLSRIESYLREEHDVFVLASLGFENTYALAMPSKLAGELAVRSIGDLARVAPRLAIAGDYEFFGRPEWQSLASRYGLSFAATRPMSSALMYQAVSTGAVDVIAAFSTDGRIVSSDLQVLEDDQRVIPPYDALVLARRTLVEQQPAVVRCLRGVHGRISAEQMRRMNRDAVEGRASPRQIARALVDRWNVAPSEP